MSEDEKKKPKDEDEKEPPADDMFIEPFPGGRDKQIEANWKPTIYWVPPLVVGGFSWLLGIRDIFHLMMLTLLFSSIISALLYYLFFSDSDYLAGLFRMFRRK